MGKKVYIKESGLMDYIVDMLGDAIPQIAATADGIDLAITIPAMGKNIYELHRTNNEFEDFMLTKPELNEETMETLSEFEDSFKTDLVDLVQRVIESLPGSAIGSVASFGVNFLEDLVLETFIEKIIEFKAKYLSEIKIVMVLNSVDKSLEHLSKILELQKEFEETVKELSEVKILPPVSINKITSKFGVQRKGYKHHGVDIGIPSGTKIVSPLDGVIIAGGSKDTGYHKGKCGGTIRISHGDNIKSRYCHVRKITFLKNGDIVKRGQVIGYSGGGTSDPHKGSSTGPHLHLEFKKDGKLVDPMRYINGESTAEYTADDYAADGFNKDNFSELLFSTKEEKLNASPAELMKYQELLKKVFKSMGNDLKESSDKLKFHIEKKIPLHENVFRIESDNYFNIINEARELFNDGKLDLSEDEIKLIGTDIGKSVKTTIGTVNLDCPFVLDEAEHKGKKVNLNKPFRTSGGPKKFAVYVKNPKTDNVKIVRFGDSNLSIKGNDQAAKKSFLARHKCDTKKDRTKAGWWSCNVHLYKKQLGLKFKGKW